MELCWLYAWAAFLLHALCRMDVSFAWVLFVFLAASAVPRLYLAKGWRRIQILMAQTVGFCIVCAAVIYGVNGFDTGFWYFSWVSDWLGQPRGMMQWLLDFLVLSITAVVWHRGTTCTCHPIEPDNMFARFDLGLAMFLVLLIVKLVMGVKGLAMAEQMPVTLPFLSYLIFGLMAVGLVRYAETGQRAYSPGFRKIGVMLSFSVVILAAAVAMILLGHAQMIGGAHLLSDVIKSGAIFLGPPLKAVLRAILMHQRDVPEPSGAPPEIDAAAAESAGEGRLLGELLAWGVYALILALILAAVCVGIWLMVRYLFSKTAPSVTGCGRRFCFPGWIAICVAWLGTRFRQWLRGIETGADFYRCLGGWGRRSGMPRQPVETPLEYRNRLGLRFPELKAELQTIVSIVNQEVYGQIPASPAACKAGKTAWRRLCSPAHWPRRAKTWLVDAHR